MQRSVRLGGANRSSMFTAVLLLCTLVLFNGCEGCIAVTGPITLDEILTAGQLLKDALQFLQKNSSVTAEKVGTDYNDLGEFLKANSVDAPHVKEMEARHTEMVNDANAFRASLDDTKRKADNLFDLLDKRANQVATQEIKVAMLNDDARKRSEFNLKLDTTRTALVTLDGYIKKYDDILAALQHQVAMQVLTGYTADVSNTAAQIAALSAKVQKAIDEGMQLIDPALLRGSDASQPPAPSTATPIANPAATPTHPGPDADVSANAPVRTSDVSPAPQREVTLAQGMPIMVRLLAPIPFGAYPEHQFVATLSQELDAGGLQIAKAGSVIHGRVAEETSTSGQMEYQMRLLLDRVDIYDGRSLSISTQTLVTSGNTGQVLAAGAVFPFPLAEAVKITVRGE